VDDGVGWEGGPERYGALMVNQKKSSRGHKMKSGIESRSHQVVTKRSIDRRSIDEVFNPYGGPYLAVKLLCERVAAAMLLIILSPVMVMAAAAIKLTSSGPIFFRQERLGISGRVFRVWKFRTMINNAEAETGPVWSQAGDPRITPLGKLLRDTHIDEFPQLFNVIDGSMSLVGPRPERPEIAAEIEIDVPAYHLRLAVRPGITGFAQIRLPADSTIDGVRRKLAFDLYYIQNLGPLLDLKILLRTALNFAWSVGDVTVTSIRLPKTEAVERLLPFLHNEKTARESFVSPPSQRYLTEMRRAHDKPSRAEVELASQ
jgi:lipopolysaccharide/colanic/teichoic acid biosynthesis glycosyltransferase